jgi:hypothetical protein
MIGVETAPHGECRDQTVDALHEQNRPEVRGGFKRRQLDCAGGCGARNEHVDAAARKLGGEGHDAWLRLVRLREKKSRKARPKQCERAVA